MPGNDALGIIAPRAARIIAPGPVLTTMTPEGLITADLFRAGVAWRAGTLRRLGADPAIPASPAFIVVTTMALAR